MRVLVAMSGGVDSSVAAFLLQQAGHEVIGLALRLSNHRSFEASETRTCCAPDDLYDARRVASQLGIPFYVVDARSEFQERVVRPFVEEYLNASTPSPCVTCNDTIKFDRLLELAEQVGADCLATGHYARIEVLPDGRRALKKARDLQRDQTYFLFQLGQDRLARVLFPLGELIKPEIRAMAEREGLPTASKHDSQELCFVSNNDYAGFIEAQGGSSSPGEIVHKDGRVLGMHRGLLHYTIGQRKGLGVAAPEPLYVLELNRERNQIVVGADADLFQYTVLARDMRWILDPPAPDEQLAARIRYRAREAPATLLQRQDGLWEVRFSQPQRAITPGQALVVYDGETIRGGGWIVGLADQATIAV